MDILAEELAGISASVAAGNYDYLAYHLRNTTELGATDFQVKKAVKVGLKIMKIEDSAILDLINERLPAFISDVKSYSVPHIGNYLVRLPL